MLDASDSKFHDPIFYHGYDQHFNRLEEPEEAESDIGVEETPVEQPTQPKGWVAWAWSGVTGAASAVASVARNAIAGEEDEVLTPLDEKKEEIEALRYKLGKLEKGAAESEEAMRNPEAAIMRRKERFVEPGEELPPPTRAEVASEKLHAEQELLACRRLIISVELKIAYELLAAHELVHTTDSDAYNDLKEWVESFEAHCNDKGRNLLADEAKFEGIGRIYSDLALKKWEASPEHDDLLAKVQSARASRLGGQESFDEFLYDLEKQGTNVSVGSRLAHLKTQYKLKEDLPQIDAHLTPLDRARFKVDALKGQTNKIAEIVRLKGTFVDGAMTLDTLELSNLKLHQYMVQTDLAEAEYDLLGLQEAGKRADLDTKITELGAAKEQLEAKRAKRQEELEVAQQLVFSASTHNLNISPEIHADVAKLEQEVAELEQGILAMENGILEIEKEITNIRRDMVEQVKQVALIRARKAAQEDVNTLLAGGKTYTEYLGKAVSAGVEVLSRLTRLQQHAKEHYVGHWEEKDWGKLIKDQPNGVFQNFSQTISDFKKEVVALEAKKLILVETRQQIAARIEELQRSPESVDNFAEALLELQRHLATLDQAIQAATAGLDDARILLRAAFLERLIAEVSTRQITLNGKEAELSAKRELITKLGSRLDSVEIGEEDRASLQEQLDQHTAAAAELAKEISTLQTQLAALRRGYAAQRRIYDKLPRGEHLLLDQLQNYFGDRLKEMLTFGAVGAGYKPVKNFDREFSFALHGYNWHQVLNDEFASVRGFTNPVEFFNAQVCDFLKFADTYPDLAQGIAADLALTLNVLQDKGPLENLMAGLRASTYTSSMLGQLGRDVQADPVLTPELYRRVARFRALADLAKWGPMAASMPGVLEAFGSGFFQNGFWGGIIESAKVAVTTSASVTITRDVMRNMTTEQTPAILAIAAVANGESVAAVLEEQRNLQLLRIGGDVRRAISQPGAAKSAIRRFFQNQRIAFQNDGTLKKIARVAAFVAPVAVGAGLGVAAFFALPFAAPAVIALAVVGAVATGLFAGSAGTRFILALPGMNSYKDIVARRHVQSKSNDLKIARDGMIQNLQEKRILRQEVKKETDHALLKELRDGPNSPLASIEQAMLADLNGRLEIQKNGLRGRELNPKDVQEVFFDVVGKRLSSAANPLSDAVDALMQERNEQLVHLTEYQKNAIKQGILDSVTQRLTESWFKQSLDPAFENELTRMVLGYQTPEQFEQAQANVQAQLNINERTARAELANAVGSMPLPPEVDAKLGGDRRALISEVTAEFKLTAQSPAAA